MRVRVFVLIAGLLIGGCTSGVKRPVSTETPLGLQMLRTEQQLRNFPFFTLLSFERQADTVFVHTRQPAQLSAERSHTGQSSLMLPPGADRLSIKLSSLHTGRDWPGRWALVGAYFYSPQVQRMTASYVVAGETLARYRVELPAEQWTAVLLDVASALAGRAPGEAGRIEFTFDPSLSAPLWCDDVLEIDNTTVHTEAEDWAVRERGFEYVVEGPLASKIVLKTPEASTGGWRLEEANVIRARFTSGKREMIIYSDGRMFDDGRLKLLVKTPALVEMTSAAQARTARVEIDPKAGRLVRNSAGDSNNDGYDESSGAYVIAAAGPRVELTIEPDAPLLRPVVLVRGLPAGRVLATMEGRLVENAVRLADGSVLLQLPGIIGRRVSVEIAVRDE